MNLFLLTTKLRQFHPVIPATVNIEPQRAAVLACLYPHRGQTHVLMTKRALHLKSHPGEISFPGGVIEEEDETLLRTALRETEEEIGLEILPDRVLGQLPPVETLTGFHVTPFVAMLESAPQAQPNSAEVDKVLEIPLAPLLATQHRDVGFKPEQEMYVFVFENHRIWGATARILHQLAQLCTHGT